MKLFAPVGLWPFGDLEPGSFDLIMADCPHRFELRSEKGESKSAQAHYKTMSLADINALPVCDLASEDCLLWYWGTAPMFPQHLLTIAAWGFTYCTHGVWVKTTKHGKVAFGTGYVLRGAHEPFIIARRGSPRTTKSVRSVIHGQVREHSRKPEEAYREAERLMPSARRLELFSRTDRPGWTSFGDQAGKWQVSA